MSRFANLVATIENLEEVAPVEDAVTAAETTAEVAEATSAVEADVTQIENVDQGIEAATDAHDKLGELTEIAETSLAAEGEEVAEGEVGQEGEGLTEKEAALVEITHETIMASLGYKVERKTYTAESFSNKRSRRQVTIDTLESLTDKAKNLGQNILKALKSAFDTVVGFIAKIINNRALMEKHLNNLESRVKALTDNLTPKDKTISAGAATLSMGGKGDASTASTIIGAVITNVAVAKKVAEILKMKAGQEQKGMADMAELKQGIDSLPVNGQGVGILAGGKAFKVTLTDADATLKEAASIKSGKDAGEFLTGIGKALKIEVVDNGGVTETMAAPDKNDLLKIITGARSALAALRDAEKTRSLMAQFVQTVTKPLVDGYFAVQRNVGSDVKKEAWQGASGVKNLVYAALRVFTKFMTTIFSQSFRTIKGAADYVNAGLKNLGGQGDKAPAEAAAS